jgi:hypothetical protein
MVSPAPDSTALQPWQNFYLLVGTAAATLTGMTTGVAFVMGMSLAVPSLAILTLTLFLVAIHGAWELLVWMALAVNVRRRSGESGASRGQG